MTIPTQLGGDLSRDDLAMWRREARGATRTGTNRESPTSSAPRVASSPRRLLRARRSCGRSADDGTRSGHCSFSADSQLSSQRLCHSA